MSLAAACIRVSIRLCTLLDLIEKLPATRWVAVLLGNEGHRYCCWRSHATSFQLVSLDGVHTTRSGCSSSSIVSRHKRSSGARTLLVLLKAKQHSLILLHYSGRNAYTIVSQQETITTTILESLHTQALDASHMTPFAAVSSNSYIH